MAGKFSLHFWQETGKIPELATNYERKLKEAVPFETASSKIYLVSN